MEEPGLEQVLIWVAGGADGGLAHDVCHSAGSKALLCIILDIYSKVNY